MRVQVEFHSGQKADERPRRFSIEGRQYEVQDVVDQWFEPESTYFKVLAGDGNLYILRQDTSTPDGAWELISYRKNTR